jgi:hypothetical protein
MFPFQAMNGTEHDSPTPFALFANKEETKRHNFFTFFRDGAIFFLSFFLGDLRY